MLQNHLTHQLCNAPSQKIDHALQLHSRHQQLLRHLKHPINTRNQTKIVPRSKPSTPKTTLCPEQNPDPKRNTPRNRGWLRRSLSPIEIGAMEATEPEETQGEEDWSPKAKGNRENRKWRCKMEMNQRRRRRKRKRRRPEQPGFTIIRPPRPQAAGD